MIIHRQFYLEKLISKKNNGMIKIVTGLRRVGKSTLLFHSFYEHLLESGVADSQIIRIDLDIYENTKYHNPSTLNKHLKTLISGNEQFYVLIDEIQLVKKFEYILNGLNKKQNIDIYVTGSNSKFLSTDIITEFRGRGDVIHLFPFSFSEYIKFSNLSNADTLSLYLTYGGLPKVLLLENPSEKEEYLKSVYKLTYIKDIVERNRIRDSYFLENLLSSLSSSIGSITNYKKLVNTYKDDRSLIMTDKTAKAYINHLMNSFILYEVSRYDVKGKKHFHSLKKYYFSDLGIRNSILNFREYDKSHALENLVYNELIMRGFSVDVGIIEGVKNKDSKSKKTAYEIDFVCNLFDLRYYIQVSYSVESKEVMNRETRSMRLVEDNFKRILIIQDSFRSHYNNDGILVLSLYDFLTDPSFLKR